MKPSRWLRIAAVNSALFAVVAAGVLILAGSASSKSPMLAAKRLEVGSTHKSIAVTGRGAPVYRLAPETTHHLLCTSRQCLSFWPPVKVAKDAKLSKDAGVSGRLGTLKRKGFDQLTLNGHPLYTFAEDKGKRGEAHGDGVQAFGGTWHVFTEAGSAGSRTGTTPATTSTTSTTSNPYGY